MATNTGPNLWSLSSSQLVSRLGLIANGDPASYDDATRAEAAQLVSELQAAIALPHATFAQQEARVAQLDSLQKRSIEVLVNVQPGS
jgi:hypothetical protein